MLALCDMSPSLATLRGLVDTQVPSEDPELNSQYAVAYVTGMQSPSDEGGYLTVAAVCKHYKVSHMRLDVPYRCGRLQALQSEPYAVRCLELLECHHHITSYEIGWYTYRCDHCMILPKPAMNPVIYYSVVMLTTL